MAIRVIDYETSGLNYHSPNFKVVSMAVSWHDEDTDEIKHWFTRDKEQMAKTLNRMAKLGDQIVAHNIAFEMGVTTTCFKGLVDLDNLLWWADTARLVQLYDNGGPGTDKQARFGLDQCVIRVLPKQFWSHKKEADTWIKQNVRLQDVKKRKLGRKIPWTVYYTKDRAPKKKEIPGFRDRLPTELLQTYNVADTDNTLRIYDTVTKILGDRGIDWRIDHEYYLDITKHIVQAQIRGIKVKRSRLEKNISNLEEKVFATDQLFRSTYAAELATIEASTGKPFNVNSKKQLAELFVGQLKMEPRLVTAKGAPSFRAAHMGQWGTGGETLKDRGKLLKVVEHCTKLLEVSTEDGRWHQSLRTTGTRTGRFAGSGGLNVQGISRRNKGLMSSLIVSSPDNVFVSMDLSAGEPTCTAHYSQDANYYAATFGMVGKAPYWKNDVLMIDDVYLMVMSVSPINRQVLLDAWKKDWGGLTFPEQWVKDAEVIKTYLKKDRQFCKILALGLGYGMGARKLVRQTFEFGRPIDVKAAKAFYRAYWDLFAGVQRFSEKCAETVTRRGNLPNAFGYYNYPEPHKAFNAHIQSTVSGIINYLTTEIMAQSPWAEFVTIIHDEIILEIPLDKVEELKNIQKNVLTNLNNLLRWTLDIRMGFVTGKDLYDAK
jgi:DNA polymerase I-like protein with 3'-5' exonuclease and polymerase domains